jgi:N-methylhydantoinase B
VAIDPITVEVLRSALPAITNEMSHVLRRTSYNMMIYEVGDYCCSILDTEGNLISQNAGGVSHFVSDLGVVIRDGVERIKDFAPGDVVITNHQRVCGQHLNNICVYTPFFFAGKLRGFAVIRAHWIDVGGFSTGFGGAAATDPWLEGLQLNQLRIYRAGVPDEGLLQVISDNIRQPESSMGDLRAQIASCNLGVKRLEELCTKYGLATVFESIAQIFTETEARCRKVIAEFQDGTFEYESFFDDSASKVDGPIRIKATVTVAGDQMTIDLSECSKQRNSVINGRTLAGPYIAYKALTRPLDPVNEGSFKALDVILPEGTFMMAQYPAPMASWSVALPTVVDVILAALAPAQPARTPAAHKGVMGDSITFFGDDPKTGRRFVVQSIEGGGWGGRSYEDGPSATVTVCQGDVRNSPIEALEQRFPIVIEQRAFRPDSGGAGEYRGGLGLDIRVRNLVPGRWNIAQTGRKRFPAWGLWGGGQGGNSDRLLKLPHETEWTAVDTNWHQVPPETRVAIQSGGGGGWGDPLKRELESVRQDVLKGMVSVQAAERDYGVVVKVTQSHGVTIDAQVDFAATKKVRQDRPAAAAAAQPA